MSPQQREQAARDADAAQALAGAWDVRCPTKLARARQLLCALAVHVRTLLLQEQSA